MLTKYIKYSSLLLIVSLHSCNLLLNQDDDHVKTYICYPWVEIISYKKILSNCKYSIQYKNPNTSIKGRFVLTLKNANRSYVVNSDEITLPPGNSEIVVSINNCNFTDEIVDVCFSTYQ